MITSRLAGAWSDYLTGTLDSAWTVYQGGDDVELARPCVIVRAIAAEEHELLRGHYEIEMELSLQSVPSETSLAEFEAAAETVHCLANELTVASAAAGDVARIVDVRETPGVIEGEDKLRTLESVVSVVAVDGQGPSAGDQYLLTAGSGKNYLIP